jgi:Flp pilus assembly protein protease CpaA
MEWWWTSVGAAVGWTVLVSLWGILTKSVANILVGVGIVVAAVLSVCDHRPEWHALGLGVTLIPAVALYGVGLVTAGTAKGFGAIGAMLGAGTAPVLWAVLFIAIIVERIRGPKKALSSHMIYFLGIGAAAAAHSSSLWPASLM